MRIEKDKHGGLFLDYDEIYFGANDVAELRAHFLAEEDKRLGRERFEVDGRDYYVYGYNGSTSIRVVDSEMAVVYNAGRWDDFSDPIMDWAEAVRQWQIKHGISVEREPQEGELWDVTFGGVLTKRCVARDGHFVNVRDAYVTYPFSHTFITSKEFVA